MPLFKHVEIKNLPELDDYKVESINNGEIVDNVLLDEVNMKIQKLENLIYSGSNNVLIYGEK